MNVHMCVCLINLKVLKSKGSNPNQFIHYFGSDDDILSQFDLLAVSDWWLTLLMYQEIKDGTGLIPTWWSPALVSGVHPNFAEHQVLVCRNFWSWPRSISRHHDQTSSTVRSCLASLGGRIYNVEYRLYHHLKFIRPLFNFAYLCSLPPYAWPNWP